MKVPVVFLIAVGEVFAAAAQQRVQLSGTVVDPAGGTIPGAMVTVHRGPDVFVREQTSADGSFVFQAEPGEYQVDVTARGFAPLHSSPIPFASAESSRFTLSPTSYSGPVVAEPAPMLPTVGSLTAAKLQESPVRHEAGLAPWEFGALFQGGVGVTEDRSNFRFLLGGVHLGKVLTGEVGPGLLRGNFEYAGELFPYWEALTPRFQRISCTATTNLETDPPVCSAPYTVGGNFHGASVTPIILRWNFTAGRRWMPWVQGAGGLVWTDHKFPAYGNTNREDPNETGPGANTSVWNFTPQFGVGTHIFVKPRQSVDFSANAVHISSASLGDRNPGVNASVQFSLGYSWWTR